MVDLMTQASPVTRTVTFRAVRVAPGSAREMQAGRDGLEVLAFGSHVPGDGEMVSDWPAS